jgi:hypothetical protein
VLPRRKVRKWVYTVTGGRDHCTAPECCQFPASTASPSPKKKWRGVQALFKELDDWGKSASPA